MTQIPCVMRDHLEGEGVQQQDGTVDPVRLASAETHIRKVALLLAKGHYCAAHRAYGSAVAEMEKGTIKAPFLESPISETGISDRNAAMIEKRFGALWVGDLLKITTAKLLLVPMVADKTVDHIWHPILRYAAKRVDGE